jgi:hypothetical protein
MSHNYGKLNQFLTSILKEEIRNLRRISQITKEIEETLLEKKIERLSELTKKREDYIQNFIELRNQERRVEEEKRVLKSIPISENLNNLYLKRNNLLEEIKNLEEKTQNRLKKNMEEVKNKLYKIYKYKELRNTYIKEGGGFFDQAFFIDKKS